MLKWWDVNKKQQVDLWVAAVQNHSTKWDTVCVLGCNTLTCHQRSLQDRSLNRLIPSQSAPLSVKCFAVSATFGMNTRSLWSMRPGDRHSDEISDRWHLRLLVENQNKAVTQMKSVRTILHIIIQNSKTLSTVIEQCTTQDNTSRLQCLWLKWYIFTKVKWPFSRPIHTQTQNLLLRYIRLLEQDWNITSNNIVNSYFFLFFARDLFSRSSHVAHSLTNARRERLTTLFPALHLERVSHHYRNH